MTLPKVNARRLGYAVLSSSDLERDIAYYTEVIGLSLVARQGAYAHLATFHGLPALTLRGDGASGVREISLQIGPGDDLARIANSLREDGLRVDRRSNANPLISDSIIFRDPVGTGIELFSSFSFAPQGKTHPGILALKLGHVAFLTPQSKILVQFYRDLLGFRLSDWRENAAYFLRCNPDHHTLNFFQSDEQRVEHIAFEMRDAADVTRACDVLANGNIRLDWGPSRHFIGHNFACYHYGPDRYRTELYAELDQMKDEELGFFEPRPWHQDVPQRPRAWSGDFKKNYWGAY